MARADATDWLLAHAGPSVRFRTARELAGTRAGDRPLLASAPVRHWLRRIARPVAGKTLHGSRPEHFENAIGKLMQLGVGAGMAPLDRAVRRHLDWLREPPSDDWYQNFQHDLVASGLSAAGYRDHPALAARLDERLHRVAAFARRGRFDLYVDPSEYPGIPRAFRDRPLIDPALHPEGRPPLPNIWDLVAFSDLRRRRPPAALRSRLDAVARYLLRDEYQRLPEGYGILRMGPRRYWAMGWDVKLPGFGREPKVREWPLALMRLELLSPFPSARRSDWFRGWLERLERFRVSDEGDGCYCLPRTALPERTSGYWVLGAYMGLEQARRSRRALVIESTFRVLRIRRGAEDV